MINQAKKLLKEGKLAELAMLIAGLPESQKQIKTIYYVKQHTRCFLQD